MTGEEDLEVLNGFIRSIRAWRKQWAWQMWFGLYRDYPRVRKFLIRYPQFSYSQIYFLSLSLVITVLCDTVIGQQDPGTDTKFNHLLQAAW